MKVCAIILAAGRGERFGGDKLNVDLGGKPLWRWSFDTYSAHPEVHEVGLVVSPGAEASFNGPPTAFIAGGGRDRQESSRLGVQASTADLVLIHDAARPFVSAEVISRVLAAAVKVGAAAPAIKVTDTIREKREDGYRLLDRSKTLAMQTPQAARRELLLQAHLKSDRLYTDEMALLEVAGVPYELVEGSAANFKVTNPEDLQRARAMIAPVETRTGLGYDIHAFSSDPSRPLWLGGVFFEGTGLDGHSDADVVIHAAVDALLGAAALGDIGQHFPNTDPRWAGMPSRMFLDHAVSLLSDAGWRVVNLDISVIAKEPKIMPRAAEIRAHLAEVMDLKVDQVSLKATTNEGMDALGRGEGIAAYATATIARDRS